MHRKNPPAQTIPNQSAQPGTAVAIMKIKPRVLVHDKKSGLLCDHFKIRHADHHFLIFATDKTAPGTAPSTKKTKS